MMTMYLGLLAFLFGSLWLALKQERKHRAHRALIERLHAPSKQIVASPRPGQSEAA